MSTHIPKNLSQPGLTQAGELKATDPTSAKMTAPTALPPPSNAPRLNVSKTRDTSLQNSLGQKFRSGLAGAVQNNDVAAARLLLQNSLNGLSIEDDDGNTPLIKAVIEQKIGMLYTLLAYAKVEHIDHQRSGDKATALHLAVYGHNPEIVKKLLGDDQG